MRDHFFLLFKRIERIFPSSSGLIQGSDTLILQLHISIKEIPGPGEKEFPAVNSRLVSLVVNGTK